MKKFLCALVPIIAITVVAIADGNSTYVHNSNNTLSFENTDIDSITLSKIDVLGVAHQGYVTHVIHTKDSLYSMPIESIDSITFMLPAPIYGPYNIVYSQEVDLGLSVNWAGWNIGANSPEELGGKYAWAEVEEKNEYLNSNHFLWEPDESTLGGHYIDLQYNISGTKYDVARKKWGGSWRMPTKDEIKELSEKCTWEYVKINNVDGFKATGPNGNSIFLPATDIQNDSTISAYYYAGTDAQADRSTSFYSSSNGFAYILNANNSRSDFYGYNDTDIDYRINNITKGLPIRPVKGGQPKQLGLLNTLTFYGQQIVYDYAEYNIYLSQCLTTTNKSQTGSLPYKSGWEFMNINRHPQWRRHYLDLGVKAKYIINEARKLNSPNYELIARTIRLLSTQLTTDAFGEMPYSDFYTYHSDLTMGYRLGTSEKPKFQDQTTIYKWMFDELDEILAMYEDADIVNCPDNIEITAEDDRIYAGNLSAWKGLAYAIKARLLLRNIPNIDISTSMCQQIIDCTQKAINAWTTGELLYGKWFGNEPRYNFCITNPSDWVQDVAAPDYSPWSQAMPKINSWESRSNDLFSAVPSKFFIQDCMGVINPGDETKQGYYDAGNAYGADPRLCLLFVPNEGPISSSNNASQVMFRYLENNIGSQSAFNISHYPNLYAGAYAQIDGYNPLFTMEELYFIQAEAYYWMGNKSKACQLAKEATTWNIQRHLNRFLADNNGYYPGFGNIAATNSAENSTNETRFKRVLTAFLDNTGTATTKACDQIGNKHWFFNETEYTLSDLMIQKYIAMYMQPEQWTDLRRYHYSNNRNGYGIGKSNEIIYPTLRRPYNLYEAYWVNGLTEDEKESTWIQRMNYDPQISEIYESEELMRLGAYKDYKWLQKPMIWAEDYGVHKSLTD